MKNSIFAAVAAVALITGAAMGSAVAGRNDVGLEASGNGNGPGGDIVVRGRPATTGAGVDARIRMDSYATRDPAINPDDKLVVVPKARAAPSGPPPGMR